MMTRYALVINGAVRNVVEQPEGQALPDLGGEWAQCPSHVGPGFTFAAGEFAEPEPAPPDPRLWWINVGPFKDRLGMDTAAIAASSNSTCRGVEGMLQGRLYVDLKDPKVLAMLNALIAANQPAVDSAWPGAGPMTPAKRDAILNTPTTEHERHIKGL